MKRKLSVILALLMLLPTLATGCGSEQNKQTTTTEKGGAPEEETLSEKIDRLYSEGIDSEEKLRELRALVWQEHVEKMRAEYPEREKELENNKVTKIKIGRTTMKVDTRIVGRKAPEGGYPVFLVYHGGGYDPSGSTNESQWSGMADRYKGTGVSGIYVSIRSVSDNESSGQIFSTDISWQFYDRIIEDAIIFENANPNKIYIVGYSAGGNGVYQIAPTMADYLASATMTAGHPEGISLTSLYNLPFYLQVGELDSAYSRNTVTVEYANKLEVLNKKYGGGYLHDCFVHVGTQHGAVGDCVSGTRSVIKDIDAWYEATKNGTAYTGGNKNAVTDAATLMTAHTRNPIPQKVVWDIETSRTKARDVDNFYWIGAKAEKGVIAASYDKASNTITIDEFSKKTISEITFYLTEDMVDLFKPVKVMYDGKVIYEYQPPISLDLLRSSTERRSDPGYQFSAELVIKLK